MAGFREYEPFEGNTAGPRAAQQRARCCCSLGPKVEAVIRRRTARGEIRKDLEREAQGTMCTWTNIWLSSAAHSCPLCCPDLRQAAGTDREAGE